MLSIAPWVRLLEVLARYHRRDGHCMNSHLVEAVSRGEMSIIQTKRNWAIQGMCVFTLTAGMLAGKPMVAVGVLVASNTRNSVCSPWIE
jgi:hypothetical protein